MYLPEKTKEQVIMEIYKKYERFIEEEYKNKICVYISSYMPSDYTSEEIEEGASYQLEVPFNAPRAIYRYYYNLEGLHVEGINIENCSIFEKTHTVLYVDNFYETQQEFILTMVRETQ